MSEAQNIKNLRVVKDFDEFKNSTSSSRFSEVNHSLIFDYIFSPIGSQNLIVFFPAAIEPPRDFIPYFRRWSYSSWVGCDVICLSDPTLHLDNQMLGGWFLGSAENWALKIVIERIYELAASRSYKSIVFCGSSMGGFNSIQAAILFQSYGGILIKPYFIAENAQVSLFDYQFKGPMNLIARTIWNAEGLDKLPKIIHLQLDLIELMKMHKQIPNGFAVFKESDHHHYDVHRVKLKKFLGEESEIFKVIDIPLSHDLTGHTPIDDRMFKDLLMKLL
jgi:hypothetical protein